MTGDLIDLMRRFNFNQTTAQVYALMLVEGPLSEERIKDSIPQTHENTDRALKQLLDLRLIGRDNRRGRDLYYAADPSFAWLSIIGDLVWSTEGRPGRMRNLPKTDDPSIEGLRLLCKEISLRAQQIYKPQFAALQHRERDAETPEELAQLTCEIIFQARKQVLAVSKSPRLPQVSSFWAVLTSRIEAGVQYHRIADLEEVIDHGLIIITRDMEAYSIDLRIVEHNKLDHSFYVVDNRFLSVLNKPFKSPRNAQHSFGRITTQHQIIDRYRKRFEKYQEMAIPGRFVVAHMSKAADQVLTQARSTLPAVEALWLESLFNYGKFSKFHVGQQWSEEQLALAEQRATTLGLVRRNTDGHIVPVYPTNEVELRSAYTSR